MIIFIDDLILELFWAIYQFDYILNLAGPRRRYPVK